MKIRALLILAVLLPAVLTAAADPKLVASRSRDLLLASMTFADRYWDEDAGLLWSPTLMDGARVHSVRESTWYALGLLARNKTDDEARAFRIVGAVLSHQFVAPGQPWDGTFRRAPEEPVPEPGAQLWKNYDPNWRQFIGTTLVLMLTEFESRLPAELSQRMSDAIRRVVVSELTEGRAEPYHTNVALMHSFLWGWAGARLDRGEWVEQSEAWAEKIHVTFARHETFAEYNSPTYYGVDFYGLALWRKHGATEKFRALGAAMEDGLWRDIARFYHAGLRNLCGPFDRAYGLDLRRYVSLTGVWMGFVLEPHLTPLPDPAGRMEHAHDFLCTPNYIVLGVNVPANVLPALREFQGERMLDRIITPKRKATAWITRDVMLGGELTQLTRGAGPSTRFQQFHPATAHWRVGTDEVGAFALRECPPVDAKADAGQLAIVTERGDSTFRIAAPGLAAGALTHERWSLPNLDVAIATDATDSVIIPGESYIDVTYRLATRFEMRVAHQP